MILLDYAMPGMDGAEVSRQLRDVGKNKVIGTVPGHMICMMYMLLKTDAELLATVPPDMEPPAPKLYDPEIHRAHARGAYVPAK